MRAAAFTAALVGLLACSAEPRHEPGEVTDDALAAYEETAERLVTRFLVDGQVVSLRDGEPHHQGDSLLWTGMALGVLPCRLVGAVEDALVDNIESNAGHVVRFRPLPGAYHGGREASLDGVLGLWWGLAHLSERCGVGPHWAHALALHFAALTETGEIYPGAATIPVGFDYVLDALGSRAGLRGDPSRARGHLLGATVAGWAYAVKQTQAAAYRIHLGFLALDAVDALGFGSDEARAMFCTATLGVGMPLIDHYCGRPGLAEWADGFAFNRFEYGLQRAPWESADGKPGLETPGLDRLVALVKLFGGGLK